MSTRPTRGRRARRSREEWRALLERFEHSGQSREQFCHEQGLTLSSFARWRRMLGKTAAGGPSVGGSPLFVEFEAPAHAARGSWDLELELGPGVVLRLRRPC
jgi:hypothetical protein